MKWFLSLVSLLALLCPLSAQQVWKVSCTGGPGIDFTDLPPAVSAASPGDTIYVIASPVTCWPAPDYYTAPVIDKPLRIIGFAAHIGSPGNPNPTSVNLRGLIEISVISAGEELILSNLVLSDAIPNGYVPHGIHMMGCQGRILLEDVSYRGNGAAMSVMEIDHCDNVVLRGCDFGLSGAEIKMTQSNVLFSNSRVYHTGSVGMGVPAPSSSTEGIRAIDSEVSLIGSIVHGQAQTGTIGGKFGAVLIDSTLRVGPATWLEGGVQSGWPPRAQGFYAIGVCVVEQDPRSVIYWEGFGAQPIPKDLDAVFHAWGVAGEQVPTTVFGPPGGFAVLAVGDWLYTPLPTPLGTLHVDPFAGALSAIVPLDPITGEYEWMVGTSVNTAVLHAFVLQGMTLSPTGEIALTIPSPLTLGWPHGVNP